MEELTNDGPGPLTLAGPAGMLALLIGVVILALGIRMALRGARLGPAAALFAAAWLPLALMTFFCALGEFGALQEIIRLGPAITPRDFAGGMQIKDAELACGALATFLGLVGAVIALARVRTTEPGT